MQSEVCAFPLEYAGSSLCVFKRTDSVIQTSQRIWQREYGRELLSKNCAWDMFHSIAVELLGNKQMDIMTTLSDYNGVTSRWQCIIILATREKKLRGELENETWLLSRWISTYECWLLKNETISRTCPHGSIGITRFSYSSCQWKSCPNLLPRTSYLI
jgi:hypothetical protein